VTDGVAVRVMAQQRVSAVTRPTVVLAPTPAPAGSPAPSYVAPVQSRTSVAGARPQITPLSNALWSQMSGRSWRRGCPVGRSGLRRVTVSYWGFDGFRHRGALVVANSTAARLGRVFAQLYQKRVRLRSIRRVETLGSWNNAVTNTLSADATFGFACQRTPWDTGAPGSHARGRVISVDPWENPSHVSGGSPDRWWLDRTGSASYVAAPDSDMVAAFAAQGFRWLGGVGKAMEFRDVR